MLPISVTILTKNSEKFLKQILTELRDFDEVVIYDTGSVDRTLDIARQFSNCTVFQEKFVGFGPTHNLASASAKHDWILSIDADEIPSEEMLNEIRQLQLQPNRVYSFPRDNYFNDKHIKGCGWSPDRVFRLYNRSRTSFTNAQVHETIITKEMQIVSLKGALRHYSYSSISEFLTKMQAYSTLFAEQYKGKKKSSLFKAIAHGWFAFFKCFFLKKGFLDGYEGFVISAYNGHTAYYKYIKLKEANQKIVKES